MGINSSTPCLACNPANPHQQQHALSGVQPCQPSSTAARPVWRATLPTLINSSTPCLACNPCHNPQQQHALSGVPPATILINIPPSRAGYLPAWGVTSASSYAPSYVPREGHIAWSIT